MSASSAGPSERRIYVHQGDVVRREITPPKLDLSKVVEVVVSDSALPLRSRKSYSQESLGTLKRYHLSPRGDKKCIKIVQNPLFASYRPKPHQAAASSSSSFQTSRSESLGEEVIRDIEDFDKILQNKLLAVVKSSAIPMPSVKLLQFEVRKYLRQEIENRLHMGQDLLNGSTRTYREISNSVIEKLVTSNSLVQHIYKRLRLLQSALKDQEYKSILSNNLEQTIENILKWDPLPTDETVLTSKDVNTFILSIEKNAKCKKVRSLINELIFEKEGAYKEIRKFINRLFKSPDILIPTIAQMACTSTADYPELIKLQTYAWAEMEESILPIDGISCHSICRSYIPSGTVLIERISLNEEIIDFGDLTGDSYESQKFVFTTLVRKIYGVIAKDFEMLSVEKEVELMLSIDAFNWEEVEKTLDSDKDQGSKLAELKQLLPNQAIAWDRIAETPLSGSTEALKQTILKCSLPWLSVLRAGTAESFGHATTLSRHLFPALNSIPFVTKSVPGITLDIHFDPSGNYNVTQQRKMGIYLRRQPDDPACFKEEGDPIGFMTLKWILMKSPPTFHLQAGWLGQLSVSDIEFTGRVSLDEKDMILTSLMKSCPLEDGWQSRPLPTYEPVLLL